MFLYLSILAIKDHYGVNKSVFSDMDAAVGKKNCFSIGFEI